LHRNLSQTRAKLILLLNFLFVSKSRFLSLRYVTLKYK
jgi:hypothetical protein